MKLLAWLRSLWPRRRSLGERGESLAARYLWWRGYHIVARRVREAQGELDIVAVRGRTIVFVEVKTRRSSELGHPAEAVTPDKQRRLTRAALAFLKRHGLLEYPARFDVIAITWAPGRRPRLEHLQHAFEAAD